MRLEVLQSHRASSCESVIVLLLLASFSIGPTCQDAHARNVSARISDVISDASDGQALSGATILLRRAGEGAATTPVYGAAANSDGVYSIRGIDPGAYVLEISFIGYETYRETLELGENEVITRSVGLEPSETELDEVLVQAERETGAARITAGHQRIRPGLRTTCRRPDASASRSTTPSAVRSLSSSTR